MKCLKNFLKTEIFHEIFQRQKTCFLHLYLCGPPVIDSYRMSSLWRNVTWNTCLLLQLLQGDADVFVWQLSGGRGLFVTHGSVESTHVTTFRAFSHRRIVTTLLWRSYIRRDSSNHCLALPSAILVRTLGHTVNELSPFHSVFRVLEYLVYGALRMFYYRAMHFSANSRTWDSMSSVRLWRWWIVIT